MILRSLFVLLAPLAAFAFIDLGVQGTTYVIQEKSIKKLIEERVKHLDKEALRKQYIKAINDAFTSNIHLPVSQSDHQETYSDYVLASYNIPDPAHPGTYLYKKGDKIPSRLPKGARINMCFIDGGNPKIASEIAAEFGRCDYLVSNADIRTIHYLGTNRVFPMGRAYVERFNIKELPVKLTMFDDQITKTHLDVRRIIQKIEETK